MNTLEAIFTRKSVRSFDSKEIEDEKIETLLKAAMSAPSAMNKQPWEFVVCKSEESRQKVISKMPFGKYKSPLIIIPCIKDSASVLVAKDLSNCDLGAASENILLAAHELGLGAVWCAIYPTKLLMNSIQKVLELPKGIIPFSALYIGYPSKDDKSVIKDKYDKKKVRML